MGLVNERKIMGSVIGLVFIGIIFSALYAGQYVADRTSVTTVSIGEAQVKARVADTPKSREQGLSGTAALPPDQGMLFVFEKPGPQPIWMKDMRYSVDIIWLDADKRVVHVQNQATPESYPTSYASPVAARYVLEVPSGFATENYIQPGVTAFFVY